MMTMLAPLAFAFGDTLVDEGMMSWPKSEPCATIA
jgi:hypothetical protein